MIGALISRLIILSIGTLYPAYASYKAVRTKNAKEYVKWMMHWTVYAIFVCIETVTDIFLSWFPFYYEVKVIIIIWLILPATKGSSTLYRKFLHPMLIRREKEIDECLKQVKVRGYSAVLQMGSEVVNYVTNIIMHTVFKTHALNRVNTNNGQLMLTAAQSSDAINDNVRQNEDLYDAQPEEYIEIHSSPSNILDAMHVEFSECKMYHEKPKENNAEAYLIEEISLDTSGAARVRQPSKRINNKNKKTSAKKGKQLYKNK